MRPIFLLHYLSSFFSAPIGSLRLGIIARKISVSSWQHLSKDMVRYRYIRTRSHYLEMSPHHTISSIPSLVIRNYPTPNCPTKSCAVTDFLWIQPLFFYIYCWEDAWLDIMQIFAYLLTHPPNFIFKALHNMQSFISTHVSSGQEKYYRFT